MSHLSRSLRTVLMVFAITVMVAASPATQPFSSPPKPVESFDAGMLRVDKFGSGKQVLVLIPGLGSGSWVWYDTITRLSPTSTIYVLTLPGFDGRAATEEKPLFTAFARDFWAMLETRKIDKPLVIGHSLGGALAIALAQEHPQRLAGIVAADGLPVFPTLTKATPAQREAMARQMATVFASMSKDASFTARKGYMSTVGTNKPELVELVAKLQARSDPKAMAAWMQELLMRDLRPDLGKITIPFVEIMPHDPADAKQPMGQTQEQMLALYQSLVAGAPKAKVIVVAPSRHFVMLDQPEPFHQAIADMLSSLHQ
ncbi:MAG: alpha/beta hydrolase [Tepidisphaeraceae bacterium]